MFGLCVFEPKESASNAFKVFEFKGSARNIFIVFAQRVFEPRESARKAFKVFEHLVDLLHSCWSLVCFPAAVVQPLRYEKADDR